MISKVERGLRVPSVATLAALAKALDLRELTRALSPFLRPR